MEAQHLRRQHVCCARRYALILHADVSVSHLLHPSLTLWQFCTYTSTSQIPGITSTPTTEAQHLLMWPDLSSAGSETQLADMHQLL